MKWPVALGITLLVVSAACEKQVKPAKGPPPRSGSAPAVGSTSQDQTPDLDQHPMALHAGQPNSTLPDSSLAPIEFDSAVKAYFQKLPSQGKQPPDGFAATVNRYCPVTPKHALKEFTILEHTVQFNGVTVGFCCDDCPEAWKTMSDDERRAALKVAIEKKADK